MKALASTGDMFFAHHVNYVGTYLMQSACHINALGGSITWSTAQAEGKPVCGACNDAIEEQT